jgi:hypothetical protein
MISMNGYKNTIMIDESKHIWIAVKDGKLIASAQVCKHELIQLPFGQLRKYLYQ